MTYERQSPSCDCPECLAAQRMSAWILGTAAFCTMIGALAASLFFG